MRDIHIVVITAGSGQGKSTIAQMMFDVMQMVGFNVELVDDNGIGIVDELPGTISDSIESRIASLRESDHKIIIQTQQVARDVFKHPDAEHS